MAPEMRLSELELVDRHRYGDPEAFEEIYGRFSSLVYNLALRMSGDPEQAADLSQEVFLRIYRKLDGFRGGSSLKTWIFQVTLNCCRSRLRRRKLRRLVAPEEEEETLESYADPRRGPEERAAVRELQGELLRRLTALPVTFREAVVLRDLQEMSYREIADVLGVRIGTVRSRIARGRERLRAAMEDS